MQTIADLDEFEEAPDMAYRRLGREEIRVSAIGYGTWSVGGIKWGETDADEALAAMHHALDHGVNLFDTAPVYGRGRSETLLGSVAQDRRDEMVIATKAGLRIQTDGSFYCDTRPEALQEDLDGSRERLRTDTIDIFQIHWPPEDGLSDATLKKLDELVSDGPVRSIGVCHFPLRLLGPVQDALPLDTVQLRFNMLQTDLFQDELTFCQEKNISVLSCTSLGKGILTGKHEECPEYPELDNRRGDPLFDPERFPEYQETVERVLEVSEEVSQPASAVALNWTHRQPGITTALAGMKTKEQVEQNVRGGDWVPSEAEEELLNPTADTN